MDKYAKRLYEEWKQHGKIIIAVDYDSTICPFQGIHQIDNNDDIIRCIGLLRMCAKEGCFLVVHTSCREDRYDEIITYCKKVGLNIDCINKTPVDMPFGKAGSKIYANIYLDDRAGLTQAMGILENALYGYRGYLANKDLKDVA